MALDGRSDWSSDDPKEAHSGHAINGEAAAANGVSQVTAEVSPVGTQSSKLCMNGECAKSDAVRRAMLCEERCCAKSDAG